MSTYLSLFNFHKVWIFLTIVLFCLLSLWSTSLPTPTAGHHNVTKQIPNFNDLKRVELEALAGRKQTDPFLINYLRQHHLYPPSTKKYRYSKLYGFRVKYINESRKVTKIIQKYLKNKRNGVFVEAGANNGADELSNTLVLERDYNWTGLLIEGSPIVFPKLIAAHRKSWKSDLLLSKSPKTKMTLFKSPFNVYAGKDAGALNENPVAVMGKDTKTPLLGFELLSVPLYSLIAACKYRTIDYLSLDVEGSELEILKNFPFDKVLIRTMIVEVNVMGQPGTKELVKFLTSKGYHKHSPNPTPRDIIFIHKSVMVNK